MRRLLLCLLLSVFAALPASAQIRGSARTPPIDPVEELRMHKLMEQQFAALKPQRPGQVDTYVLSLALWDDHVFQHEAEGAADVLAQRFNAQGRTIVLTNGEGPGVPRTHPGARPADIGAALARIGEVMDPNEDVLALFVTTHGNSDGSLAVREQYNTTAIYPMILRQALDQTQVKNRLVILSACFAAAHIPALSTDTTMVFAAAASDRTSFGCEPQREWTFFGDAFMNQALRQNRTLPDAFETAKVLIQAWEARERTRPSLPQSFIGPDTRAIAAAMTGKAK